MGLLLLLLLPEDWKRALNTVAVVIGYDDDDGNIFLAGPFPDAHHSHHCESHVSATTRLAQGLSTSAVGPTLMPSDSSHHTMKVSTVWLLWFRQHWPTYRDCCAIQLFCPVLSFCDCRRDCCCLAVPVGPSIIVRALVFSQSPAAAAYVQTASFQCHYNNYYY